MHRRAFINGDSACGKTKEEREILKIFIATFIYERLEAFCEDTG